MNITSQNIFIQVPSYVFYKDCKSVFLGCNINFASAAGLKNPDEIIGKTDYDLPWVEQASLYQLGDQEVLDGVSLTHIIEPQSQANGKIISILINKTPLLNNLGEKIGVIGSFMEYINQRFCGTIQPTKHNIALPPRQVECLFFIAQGMTAKQISNYMGLSKRTIEGYIEILKAKLGCYNKAALIKKAWTFDLIKQRLLADYR